MHVEYGSEHGYIDTFVESLYAFEHIIYETRYPLKKGAEAEGFS